MNYSTATCLILALGYLVDASKLSAQSDFGIVIQSSTHAEAHAYGSGSQIQDNPSQSGSSVLGAESSSCGAGEERKSNGASAASAVIGEISHNQRSVVITSTAYANGGHFIRCNACVSGVCLGRNGEDTSALSRALSRVVVDIRFKDDVRLIDYILDIGSSSEISGAKLMLRLEDPEGKVLLDSSSAGGTFTIQSQPGKAYRISAMVEAQAEDKGGCCSIRQSGSASILISLYRAPILSSRRIGRIVGGHETKGFPTVGAILIDGKMHCTGTLVGSRTVLTAAHCLYEYEPKKMSFVIGYDIDKPEEVLKAEDEDYPKGENGLEYNDYTLEDDIGVLYLEKKATKISSLHRGVPALGDLIRDEKKLIFVGFGYKVVDGEKIGLGIKRMVEMHLKEAGDKFFSYAVPDKNTCNGDSGGPAFADGGGQLLVAGVTSWGDEPCLDYGVDTRVERYIKWLEERIR